MVPVIPPRLPFFVYGTLRPGEPNHALLLRGRSLTETPARLPGAVLYDGPGYPYAVADPAGTVTGELVVPAPEAYGPLLAELDRLEEYRAGDPSSLYERVVRGVLPDGRDGGRVGSGDRVRTWADVGAGAGPDVSASAGQGCGTGGGTDGTGREEEGGSVRAWVYLAGPAVAVRLRARGRLIPSGDWRDRNRTRKAGPARTGLNTGADRHEGG
ncbi:gamma-glutamylcyclotransferase family protein [Streptomyces sp. NPDC057052]|uniref:gamma-glutamylcyclotransferase family protein n=1 Tax=Streptomyces sp. NPDC057052 TaxID=3346010 RepID=UPI0036304616